MRPSAPGNLIHNAMAASFQLRTLTTPQELFSAAAEEVVNAANQAVSAWGRFRIALSGGSTPKSLFTLLATNARTSFPWEKTYFFWSDERHVPPDHADSNYRMAEESLLSKVPVPAGNIFRVPAENPDAAAVAQIYETTLRKAFGIGSEGMPTLDLILLGMGPDGHTASLFPETTALREKTRLVVANWVEKLKASRITFTLPLINAARSVIFLVSGTDKAPALHEVLEGNAPGEQYPTKLVHPNNGNLIWFVDRAAASQLTNLG